MKKLSAEQLHDKHWLYQNTVQHTEHEVGFLKQVYGEINPGKSPTVLREDFCGTGLLCGAWANDDESHQAFGLDIDAPTLQWGRENNIAKLGEAGERIELLEQDVLRATKRKADVIAAYNYSYSVFKERKTMLQYLSAARKSLSKNGVFIMDAWGGWETGQEITDVRKCKGYKYYWEQESFDPITHDMVCHISFKLKDGTKFKHAFTYEWRYWTLAELRDCLHDAGFKKVQAYWEGDGDDGTGDGIFTATNKAPKNDPGWNAYLAAWG